MIKNRIKNLGFTLVESLVAISILSLSILSTFTAVSNGLQYSGLVKEKITAFYLIQEGMEYMRNIRDENALNNLGGNTRTWLYGIAQSSTDPCYFGKTCALDMNSSGAKLTYCGTSFDTCSVLRQNSTTGAFGFNGTWNATTFKREIQLSTLFANSDQVKITIRISWVSRGLNKSLTVSQLLYNRQ